MINCHYLSEHAEQFGIYFTVQFMNCSHYKRYFFRVVNCGHNNALIELGSKLNQKTVGLSLIINLITFAIG